MERKILPCPKCSTQMEQIKLAGTELDNCPFCNGCWLDKEEVGKITRSRGQNRLEVELTQTSASDVQCPRCKTPSMLVGQHVHVPSLFLDQCQTCSGVWLDRGELTTLLSYRQAPPNPTA
jgi:Zn-finger nucleic acid-binding protein